MPISWFYGLALTDDAILAYAKSRQLPTWNDTDTFISAVDEAAYELEMHDIFPRIGVDLVDHSMRKIAAIHVEKPNESRYTAKDEERLRKLFGIKEKGRWFRCLDCCDMSILDEYVPPPMPV